MSLLFIGLFAGFFLSAIAWDYLYSKVRLRNAVLCSENEYLKTQIQKAYAWRHTWN
jgi:hypothetical protein